MKNIVAIVLFISLLNGIDSGVRRSPTPATPSTPRTPATPGGSRPGSQSNGGGLMSPDQLYAAGHTDGHYTPIGSSPAYSSGSSSYSQPATPGGWYQSGSPQYSATSTTSSTVSDATSRPQARSPGQQATSSRRRS